MVRPETLQIEIAYALPEEQILLRLTVPAGTTAGEAIAQSELAPRFGEPDLSRMPLGIFGRRVGADHRLHAGDRIEIYRPLLIDPKAERRRRVAGQRRSRT